MDNHERENILKDTMNYRNKGKEHLILPIKIIYYSKYRGHYKIIKHYVLTKKLCQIRKGK